MAKSNVSTQGQIRLFVQPGGPSVANPLLLAGVDLSYSQISGVSNPRLGGIDPINRFDPNTAQAYLPGGAGRKVTPPKLPGWKWEINEALNGIPLPDIIGGCPVNFYDIKGACDNLSDPLRGWKNGNVRIYSNGQVVNDDEGARASFETDNELMQSLDMTGTAIYATASIAVSTPSVALLSDKLVKDICYAPKLLCANCGTANDGTKWIYGCTAAGTTSPGTKPYVIYSTDGGANYTAVQVTSAAVAEDLVAIGIAAGYVFAVSKTGGGSSTSAYHYAQINQVTGAPGTWTKVTTGFVGGAGVNDVFVLSDNKIYMSADAGYIYLITNITAGVNTVQTAGGVTSQNLLRITGTNDILVASGATSTILISKNLGVTWSAAPSAPTVGAVNYTALAALDPYKLWIGTSTGRVLASVDGGNTWPYEITVQGTGGTVNDIVFATPEVGYFLNDTSGPVGQIYRTFNGGALWDNGDPSIVGLGSNTDLRRIAVPVVGATPTVLGKNFAVAGGSTATAGVVVSGAAPVF